MSFFVVIFDFKLNNIEKVNKSVYYSELCVIDGFKIVLYNSKEINCNESIRESIRKCRSYI